MYLCISEISYWYTIIIAMLSKKHWWFSGRILACHAGDPGSIPGQCKFFFFSLIFFPLIILTSSHRMPYGHVQSLPIDNRRTFKHGIWFLRGWPGALSTCHTWRAIVRPEVYTRNCFSESMGSLQFGGPRQKALLSVNEFTLLWIFA